jgi:hypothetical protein
MQTLQICVAQRFNELEDYRSFHDEYPNSWAAASLRLQRCPLRSVTVIMTDENFGQYADEWDNVVDDSEAWQRLEKQYRLTDAEKRSYCSRLSEKVLGPPESTSHLNDKIDIRVVWRMDREIGPGWSFRYLKCGLRRSITIQHHRNYWGRHETTSGSVCVCNGVESMTTLTSLLSCMH